jgi:hypothetical protein
MREAEFVQQASHRAQRIDDAEARRDDGLEIGPLPAHHAVRGKLRTGLDNGRKRVAALGRKLA